VGEGVLQRGPRGGAELLVRIARPTLRVVWMPRPPLACAFAPDLAAVSDY